MKRSAPRRLRLSVELQVASRTRDVPTLGKVRHWIRSALAPGRGTRSIGVRLVDRAEGRRLNSRYRAKDYASNVLSFPAPPRQPGRERLLGDLVICAPVVAAEARAQGKELEAHFAHLVVHGTLHLLGHDHERPPAARSMEAREIRILARLGYSNPYEPSKAP